MQFTVPINSAAYFRFLRSHYRVIPHLTKPGRTDRAYRAHMNAFEGLALFAPLAIAVDVSGSSNEITVLACVVYFWTRLIYAPLYYFNVPYVKTSAWSIGLGATLTLAYQLLTR
ncbi:MAG: MAPEG family protein [Pseudomonadota bacterium]|nr:MAPEG family protein [Pseudomonadota bacterium]